MRMPRPARAVEPWKEKFLNSIGSSETSGDEGGSLIRNICAYVKYYTAAYGRRR
jgi:hypothetical protein